jgi:hypothetical protein
MLQPTDEARHMKSAKIDEPVTLSARVSLTLHAAARSKEQREMNLSKTQLLVACAASTFIASAAQAQVLMPSVELRGGGATSVGDIVPRTMNCIGRPSAGLNQYGTNSGSLSTIAPGLYSPTTPSATNPVVDCSSSFEIQPNFEGKYIGTGSGTGRSMWRTFSTANLNGTAGNINPFSGGSGNPSGWTNLQFAFSDGAISTTELGSYNNTANNSTNKAGAAIQIPFFVLPVAVAYSPVYGLKGATELTFNVKTPGIINGVTAGGLKLSRSAYCKIFNGEITNWNDAALKTLNSNISLHDATDDTLSRWTAEGAPIRLVGRADNSGTTDIFTRALAAQCTGLVTTNKFTKNAANLPFVPTGGGIDIRKLLGSSEYNPLGQTSTGSAASYGGAFQSLSGFVWDKVGKKLCKYNELDAGTNQCTGTLSSQGLTGDGLFLVADGSSGVAEAILTNDAATNTGIASAIDNTILLNGKVGYIGADWIVPVTGRSLFAAALQTGVTTAYVMPSATNASAAFGTALFPPQTTATSGAFNVNDTRTVGATNPLAIISGSNVATPLVRSNPLHWAAAIYNPNITTSLAAPAAGYPITGATYLLTYTCFKPADPAVPGNNAGRFAVANYMGLLFGKVTKNSAGTALSANTFKGTGATSLGIVPGNNIAQPPAGWQTAITETFLKKSTQSSTPTGGGAAVVLGTQNLWIQDAAPSTASDVDGLVQATDQNSNPGCDATTGA